jgi:hypothetical protein
MATKDTLLAAQKRVQQNTRACRPGAMAAAQRTTESLEELLNQYMFDSICCED